MSAHARELHRCLGRAFAEACAYDDGEHVRALLRAAYELIQDVE